MQIFKIINRNSHLKVLLNKGLSWQYIKRELTFIIHLQCARYLSAFTREFTASFTFTSELVLLLSHSEEKTEAERYKVTCPKLQNV